MAAFDCRLPGIAAGFATAKRALPAALLALLLGAAPAAAKPPSRLGDFLPRVAAADLVPEADRIGEIRGDPPAAPVYDDDELEGYAFLNSDIAPSVGYSGKPIHILIGLDLKGVITGLKLVEHSEPIVLIGIPQAKIVNFIDGYVGRDVTAPAALESAGFAAADVISGATVTMMVIDDSILFAAATMARTLGLGRFAADRRAVSAAGRTVDMTRGGVADWSSLLADRSVARLDLTVGEIDAAFERAGYGPAAGAPTGDRPEETFIELYAALASVPVIGRSLLGKAEYKWLTDRLRPSQQAVLIAGRGRYSFKGSGYVRGGIFDRFQIIQEATSIRFRDRDHKRLGEIAAEGAPHLRDIGLFVIPADLSFDPTRPWRLELLVQRPLGPREKAYLSFSLDYRLPAKYLTTASPTPVAAAAPTAVKPRTALWQRIWRARTPEVAALVIALASLTLIFFFQDWLVARPRLFTRVRLGFLVFVLVWLGWIAGGQLSVVNVLTFANSLRTDFSWDYFLTEPLLFILWFAVAASILFWGRGPFCGWLCPFGALQELVNKLGRLARIPQLRIPWSVHERLWPIKYIVFLILFGLSLYSLDVAERAAEVEPFKTAIILKFVRDWPFTLFAISLLIIGLFVERVYCRYLCPLGAALAIPGRLRMFDWLKRHSKCGAPCQICAVKCMVQSIHPDGRINPNECIYCLECLKLYYDDRQCPAMVERRLRRERRLALQSSSMAGRSKAAAAASQSPLAGRGGREGTAAESQ